MEERINVAEILKHCPKGMELDCITYNGVATLGEVTNNIYYPISINISCNNENICVVLTEYGQTAPTMFNKCVIFPKGKTTWEGFQRPFKDGDIVCTAFGSIVILKSTNECSSSYCGLFHDVFCTDIIAYPMRLATEEEKRKLFDAIKANGYKWNAETKTLEKLPKFKVGDWLQYRLAEPFFVEEITEQGYVNGNSCLPFEWENEIHLWTIQDAKDGDVLVHNSFPFIFMGIKNGTVKGICTELGDTILNFGNPEYANDYCPATKEHRDLLFQKMKESGYEWNAEKKELKKIEQTPAWSEEDIKMIEILVAIFETNYPNGFYKVNPIGTTNMQGIHSSEIIKWLKSLKDRCTWKPSDKQMEQLGWIAEQNKNNMIGKELMTLYNDLKKLKE